MLTKEYVAKVYSLLEQGDMNGFLEQYVDDNVNWTITGSSVLAGTYHSRQEFIDKALIRMKQSLATEMKVEVHHIYVDGDIAIVEMNSIAQAKKGHPYHNQYLWVQQFRDGKIITVRMYCDDVLVNETILE